MEVSAFMTEQLKEQPKEQRDHDEKVRKEMEVLRKEAEAQRREAEAKLDAQREETDAQRQVMEANMEVMCHEVTEARVRDAQLHSQQIFSLQARLEELHAAKLLADEELFALEDIIVDAGEAPDGGRAAQMVALYVRVAADVGFSRQLRRKFIQ